MSLTVLVFIAAAWFGSADVIYATTTLLRSAVSINKANADGGDLHDFAALKPFEISWVPYGGKVEIVRCVGEYVKQLSLVHVIPNFVDPIQGSGSSEGLHLGVLNRGRSDISNDELCKPSDRAEPICAIINIKIAGSLDGKVCLSRFGQSKVCFSDTSLLSQGSLNGDGLIMQLGCLSPKFGNLSASGICLPVRLLTQIRQLPDGALQVTGVESVSVRETGDDERPKREESRNLFVGGQPGKRVYGVMAFAFAFGLLGSAIALWIGNPSPMSWKLRGIILCLVITGCLTFFLFATPLMRS